MNKEERVKIGHLINIIMIEHGVDENRALDLFLISRRTKVDQEIEIKKLIKETRKAGELNPKYTLKIIISNIMKKYNIKEDKATILCLDAMNNM